MCFKPVLLCCFVLIQERRRSGIHAGDRSLLAFMLRHQQQQQGEGGSSGGLQVSDKDIRDQLMTFMFAGGCTAAMHGEWEQCCVDSLC
jgi:cytochrome P450